VHTSNSDKPHEARFEKIQISDKPKEGYARVKLSAVSLNKRDEFIIANKYGPNIADGSILGSDGVGTLVDVGHNVPPHVSGLLNKRVVVLPSVAWGDKGRYAQEPSFRVLGCQPDNGTFAEYSDFPAENIVPAPDALDDVQAAALPLAGLTAWRAVKTRGQVKEGDRVLITGAGSGVSTYMMQFAKALGAEVYTTSSSKTKIDFAVKTLGAKGGVNYKDEDWTEQLVELADSTREKKQVFDVVIDSSGSLEQCLTLLAPGGRYVFFGNTTRKDQVLSPAAFRSIYFFQLQLIGTTMGSPEEFQELLEFVDTHNVKPVVSGVEPFTEAGWNKQIEEMKSGNQLGKLVLKL